MLRRSGLRNPFLLGTIINEDVLYSNLCQRGCISKYILISVSAIVQVGPIQNCPSAISSPTNLYPSVLDVSSGRARFDRNDIGIGLAQMLNQSSNVFLYIVDASKRHSSGAPRNVNNVHSHRHLVFRFKTVLDNTIEL